MDSNNRRGGGFGRDNYQGNRENRDSGYNRDNNRNQGGYQQGGGYNNDRGGYNNDRNAGNNDRGGYNNDRGGYNNNRGGGYGGGGGYNNNRGGGGYNDRGGYNNNRGGGYGGGDRGGYNRPFNDRDNRETERREDVHSVKIQAGKRTYFFDVKQTQAEDFYITITESKRRLNGMGYEKHKIFLYKEDFNKFIEKLTEVVNHTKGLMPGVDFEAFDHREERQATADTEEEDPFGEDDSFDFDTADITFGDTPEEGQQ